MSKLFQIFKVNETEFQNNGKEIQEPQSQDFEELLIGISG